MPVIVPISGRFMLRVSDPKAINTARPFASELLKSGDSSSNDIRFLVLARRSSLGMSAPRGAVRST
jgi:hypothetical protein